jgi:hypothetical protein
MMGVTVIKELWSIKWIDRTYKLHLVINGSTKLCSFADLLETASPSNSRPVF